MEKRSNDRRVYKQDLENQAQANIDAGRVKRFANMDEAIKSLEKLDTGESPPKTVRLASVIGAGKHIVIGAVTGRRYEFTGGNALEIDMDDAEILLAKRVGGCCGNKPTPIFVKV